MIMQWTKEDDAYTATWQSIKFVLSQHPETQRWIVKANGERVKQAWTTAKLAMEDIENRQQKLIMKAGGLI